MKNILCKLGIHRREKHACCKITRNFLGEVERLDYFTCKRCGKLLGPFIKRRGRTET